jgi:hypothetical protein
MHIGTLRDSELRDAGTYSIYTCAPGYKFHDDTSARSLVCLPDGTWHTKAPRCISKEAGYAWVIGNSVFFIIIQETSVKQKMRRFNMARAKMWCVQKDNLCATDWARWRGHAHHSESGILLATILIVKVCLPLYAKALSDSWFFRQQPLLSRSFRSEWTPTINGHKGWGEFDHYLP